jgi:hypothetical protein
MGAGWSWDVAKNGPEPAAVLGIVGKWFRSDAF